LGLRALSDYSAALIDEWHDPSEDDVWIWNRQKSSYASFIFPTSSRISPKQSKVMVKKHSSFQNRLSLKSMVRYLPKAFVNFIWLSVGISDAKTHLEFKIDKTIQHKLLITVAPDGYLKQIC
jgi:hypothetical protein